MTTYFVAGPVGPVKDVHHILITIRSISIGVLIVVRDQNNAQAQ